MNLSRHVQVIGFHAWAPMHDQPHPFCCCAVRLFLLFCVLSLSSLFLCPQYKMIDISQWRAGIGLWNYYQAASPASGRHSHSFKAAVDSKSEKTFKLPEALSLIAFLLFLSLSLSRHILLKNYYQVQCTAGDTVNYLQSVIIPGGSSSNLIYNDFHLIACLRMLLLLSGDVELNPGPMIDDQPDIFLLLQWLEPLVDWKPFGLLLPRITQQDIAIIEEMNTEHQKLALFTKWLNTNPTATWRDVLDALTKREEINLLQTINDQVQIHQCTGGMIIIFIKYLLLYN